MGPVRKLRNGLRQLRDPHGIPHRHDPQSHHGQGRPREMGMAHPLPLRNNRRRLRDLSQVLLRGRHHGAQGAQRGCGQAESVEGGGGQGESEGVAECQSRAGAVVLWVLRDVRLDGDVHAGLCRVREGAGGGDQQSQSVYKRVRVVSRGGGGERLVREEEGDVCRWGLYVSGESHDGGLYREGERRGGVFCAVCNGG